MNKLKGKNILLISPEPWGKSYLSKHHYALALCDLGNRVWFLSPERAAVNYVEAPSYPALTVINDLFYIRGLRFFPKFIQRAFMSRAISKLEKRTEIKFDVIWSFDSSRYFDLSCFKNGFRIFHMVDFHYDYNLATMASSADLCLGVTNGIVHKLKQFNSRSFFIQHGFDNVAAATAEIPKGDGKYKAMYAGNLLMKFIDWELADQLFTQFPQVDFYLVGSFEKGNLNRNVPQEIVHRIKSIGQRENVFLLGEKSANELPFLFAQADVLLMLYDHRKYPNEVANSHKILSYLASGKVIVANETMQYLNSSLLEMAASHEEYITLFSEVLQHLGEFNSDEQQSKRRNYAMDNTYVRQLERIEVILENEMR